MRFDFDSATRRRLGYRLIDQIDAFFSSLPDRPVQLPLEQRSYGPLHHALPETGEDAEKVLDELFREMVEQGFHVPSANYFGLMNPTPTYMGVLGETLVAGLNPQLATLARSQLASKIELETVRWIGERVGWAGGLMGLSPVEATKPISAVWLWHWRPGFQMRWKKGWLRSAASQSATRRRSRTTRSTNRRGCWESDARRCDGSR